MEVVRTFHPVGQGAFYSERFYDCRNIHYVVVYDCGTETAESVLDVSLDEQIDLFKGLIDPIKKIDILFISHFHADHISGIERLIANVKVDRTVIPMLDYQTIMTTRLQNYLRYDQTIARNADRIIKSLYLDEGKDERFGEVVVVSPDTVGELHTMRDGMLPRTGRYISSGSVIPLGHLWEYVPYNSIEFSDPRALAIVDGLKKINGEPLDIEALIRDHLDEVRKVYRKAIGYANDNLYTLVVVSQPVEGIVPQPIPRLSHCIYFGDYEYKKNSLWDKLRKRYAEIGTVQVPHHGAKGNWKTEMGDGDPRHYIVSSGSTNGHHHPNFWVLQEIWDKGHRFFVVSEKETTRREYWFYV